MTTMTKADFIAQCKKETPEMVQTINGIETTLSDEDYNKAVDSWAEMQMEIQNANTLASELSNPSTPQAGE